MTTYAGWVYELPQFYQQQLTGSLDDGLERWTGYQLANYQADLYPLQGSVVHSGSTTRVSHTYEGHIVPAWDTLLFGHILIVPPRLDMGNILSTQIVSIEMANLFTTPQDWESIANNAGEGVFFNNLPAFPREIPDFGSFVLQAAISELGPEIIDGHILLEFESETIQVPVTGVRVVGWPWEPTWNEPVIERLEWITDVQSSYNGSEQVMQLRGGPRQYWEFEYMVQGKARRTFENALFDWGGRVWAVPVWSDVETTLIPHSAGTTVIPMVVGARDFRIGGVGMIIDGPEDDVIYESFEIINVTNSFIELKRPLVNHWPAGSRVYPVHTARFEGPRSSMRSTRNIAHGNVVFKSLDEIEGPALVESTMYRGYPVQTHEPNWRQDIETDYSRNVEVIGSGIGRDYYKDKWEISKPIHKFLWTAMNRNEADVMRGFIFNRKGRFGGIWLPTWQSDLIVKAAIGAAAAAIDFERAGLVQFANANIHRRDIRIQLKNGQVFYRRTSTYTLVDPTTERMVINAPLGQIVTPEQIERVSWMNFVRLDHDMVEIAWYTPNIAEAALIMRGPRNDF